MLKKIWNALGAASFIVLVLLWFMPSGDSLHRQANPGIETLRKRIENRSRKLEEGLRECTKAVSGLGETLRSFAIEIQKGHRDATKLNDAVSEIAEDGERIERLAGKCSKLLDSGKKTH